MKLFNIKYAILLCAIFLYGWSVNAQDENQAVKNKQRVNYIYNFTKYITWDNLADKSEFTIALYGEEDEALLNEFTKTAAIKKINGLTVKVKSINSISDINNLEILYVHKGFEINLEPVLSKLYENHALLVTEGLPFHESMINFIEIDDEFQFEISEDKINKASLLVDPALTSFSIQSTVDWDRLYKRLQEEIATVQDQQAELDKLSEEIAIQKKEIEEQQTELTATLNELKAKNTLVQEQDILIKNQEQDIRIQLNKLKGLLRDIENQSKANEALKKTYEGQLKNIEIQSKKLNNQELSLKENLSEIDNQNLKIDEQNKILDEQLSDLERQQTVSWISIIFGILAISFIVFMVISNKRRRKSEVALQKKNEELINLNHSLDSFTYRVSHDLKAPIVNMKTMIQLLNEYSDKEANPILPELFANLDLSTNRLESTVIDMLELTRIERVEEIKSVVNIKEIFDDLIQEYHDELERTGAEVTIDIEQEFVYASDTELKSIFQNLFTNSMKYRSKENDLRISISSSLNKNRCHLVYKDNGQGIDLKRHEKKLFSMFQRFTADSSISGTGVGMYIINKLITKNGGDVKLESEPEKGLTYFINFPLEKT
ncbi:MAG: chemotaxis family two-component system sensor kinase Cph1 [Arenicella sp.]